MRVALIGAGPASLAAGMDLAKAGHQVVCFEASDQVGGLAGGFRQPGWKWSLEKYYHHWFQTDAEVLKIADELGVRDKVLFPQPVTVLYDNGQFYAFDSPIAVLKFPGIPFIDRLRFGFVGAYLRFTRNWKKLEQHEAHEWLNKWLGKRAYEALWEPMLEGKFGLEHYRSVNMAWFWARIHARTRCLGTFEGGFQAFFDCMAQRIRDTKGEIRLSQPVDCIKPLPGGRLTLSSGGKTEEFDRVMCAASPEQFARMTPDLPADFLKSIRELKSLGAVVLTLALKQPLGNKVYWYNLPKKAGFPFLCLVEHTNYVSREHFGGDSILYCGDYVPDGHPYLSMSKEELLKKFLPSLKKINPVFEESWVKETWLYRTPYGQPIPMKNHSARIPPIRTPIPGLYWASMSHVYPWDRGTNYAFEIGRRTAGMILKDLEP